MEERLVNEEDEIKWPPMSMQVLAFVVASGLLLVAAIAWWLGVGG